VRKIVKANDGAVPVDEILCTTYQMRDFYKQFRDGFFNNLDAMNMVQHLYAVRQMREGDTVLDVCCGRGALLKLMKYNAKGVAKYIGVDISEENMRPWTRDSWKLPFEVEPLVCDVAEMSEHISGPVDLAVYTSSIEHMHKDHGERSLGECAKLLRQGGRLLISCPRTPEGGDGYDVRYKAHVYEWTVKELMEALQRAGFALEEEFGILGNVRDFRAILKAAPAPVQRFFEPMLRYVPREFLAAILFAGLPMASKEVLIKARRL